MELKNGLIFSAYGMGMDSSWSLGYRKKMIPKYSYIFGMAYNSF